MHTEVTFLIHCSLLCAVALCLRGQCTYLSKKYFTAKKKKKETFTAKRKKKTHYHLSLQWVVIFLQLYIKHHQNFIKSVKASKFTEEFEILWELPKCDRDLQSDQMLLEKCCRRTGLLQGYHRQFVKHGSGGRSLCWLSWPPSLSRVEGTGAPCCCPASPALPQHLVYSKTVLPLVLNVTWMP